MKTLEELKELWDELGDIPVNNNDEIEKDFLGYPAGTDKLEIWDWFDEQCPNRLVEDLMFKNKEN